MATLGNIGTVIGAKASSMASALSAAPLRNYLSKKYKESTFGISRSANSIRNEKLRSLEQSINEALAGDLSMDYASIQKALVSNKDDDGNTISINGKTLSSAILQAYQMVFTKLGRNAPKVVPNGAMIYYVASLMCTESPEYFTSDLSQEDLDKAIITFCGDTKSSRFAPEGYHQESAAAKIKGRGTGAQPMYAYASTQGTDPKTGKPFIVSSYGPTPPSKLYNIAGTGKGKLYGGRKTRKARKSRKQTRKGRKGSRK